MKFDPFTLTLLLILIVTLVAAFVKRLKKDKCVKEFAGDFVTLEEMAGRTIWGKLRVENTGIEFIYAQPYKDKQGHIESSYILYKYEYPNIQALVRFHDDLTEQGKIERQQELKRTYHPKFFRRLKRKFSNLFKTIRDALAEVVNVIVAKAKKTSSVGSTLTTQDKYVSQIKNELMGTVGASYEPLLERYIGRKVVLELAKGDKVIECPGVLKDYTAEFIEMMDVDYSIKQDEPARKADIVVLRKYAAVRHLAE